MYEIFDKLMKEKGVRFADISRETGVSYSTFTDWKAGRYTPKDEKMQKIADYFGVSVHYLRTGELVTVNPNKLTTDFRNLLRRNNLPAFRFHDLRHYSASIQHALGVPDAFIISRGGWQTDATLKAVYRHALTDKQKEMDKKINAHFERLTAHDTAHGGEQSQ